MKSATRVTDKVSDKEGELSEVVPYSEEAEMGVLGCVLLVEGAGVALGVCIEKLRPGVAAFYDARHQEIYSAMLELYEAKTQVDLITLRAELKRRNRLDEVGGVSHLAACQDSVPSGLNLDYYIEIVMEKYVLRTIQGTCVRIGSAIREQRKDSGVLLDEVEQQFLEISKVRGGSPERTGMDLIRAAVERLENYDRGGAQMLGFSTGFDYLDKMLCGLQPGQLVVIAARPGAGKTSFMMALAEHMTVKNKIKGAIFSMEMTTDELSARLMFQVGRADYQRFRTGYLQNSDMEKLTRSGREIALSGLVIDDTSGLNVLQLRSKARRFVKQYGVQWLAVDYLQLMKATRHMQNREQEVAEISVGLKGLAKELKVPVIVCAQLNRELEREPNRKPRLSDLRESGQIEADADVVGMLYEPKLKDAELEALSARDEDWSQHFRRINMLIAKQRNGPTGDVEFEYWKSSMRFEAHKRPPRQVVEE
jgi:replicative DNA helicase